jgi:ABC-type uncharacterized transport system involved in gliding motility auxiliary subunit
MKEARGKRQEAGGRRQEAGGRRQEAGGRWGRSARYGSNAVVLSVAAIGIVVMLNLLAARYYRRFDITQGRLHSLSPQSLQVLDGLDGAIEIVGLYPNGQGRGAFERWLDEYRAHMAALDYRTVDPIRQPGEAERLGWDLYGPGLLVRRGERSQQVTYPDEQEITSALLKVSREGPKTVYLLGGHNERSPTDPQGAGYGDVAALLEKNNYQVRSLNLAVTGEVPGDAALLVIAGPRSALLPDEEQRIRSYLLAGGKALILVDPMPAERGVSASINALLEPWQVRFADATAVDPQQSLGGDPLTPALTGYGFHPITKDLANTLIALPLATPILLPGTPGPGMPVPGASEAGAPEAGVTDKDAPISYSVLAMTSEQSWGESDIQSEPLRYDEGADLPGPLIVAVAVTGDPETPEAPAARLVLIGDSDLARNDVLAQIPNGQYLLLNAVNWLAEEEALIAIGPKTGRPSTIRLSGLQEAAVGLGALLLIPGAIALAGLIVWSRRRRPRPSGEERP